MYNVYLTGEYQDFLSKFFFRLPHDTIKFYIISTGNSRKTQQKNQKKNMKIKLIFHTLKKSFGENINIE